MAWGPPDPNTLHFFVWGLYLPSWSNAFSVSVYWGVVLTPLPPPDLKTKIWPPRDKKQKRFKWNLREVIVKWFQSYTAVSKQCTLHWYVLKSMSWKMENKFVNGGGSNALRRWQNDGEDYYYRLKCDNLRTWPSGSRWSESNRQDSWKTAVVAELTSVLGILDNGSHVQPRNELFQHLYSHPSLSWQWTWRLLDALHDCGFPFWTVIVF
jgi:hypothetical protein